MDIKDKYFHIRELIKTQGYNILRDEVSKRLDLVRKEGEDKEGSNKDYLTGKAKGMRVLEEVVRSIIAQGEEEQNRKEETNG